MMEIQRSFFDVAPERLRIPSRPWDNGFELHNRRYIGNKHKLTNWIFSILNKECRGASFADVFAGTGVIGAAASEYFHKIILNDFLYSNYVVYKAFFEKGTWNRKKLFALVSEYNGVKADSLRENYFSKHFGGKYFSNNSAKIIGFIRQNIEENKSRLTAKEYYILTASLLYSADKIANTVGHYDAYFKNRLLRDNFYMRIIYPFPANSFSVFKEDANVLVKKIKADIVYIDPPYNSRQYSRFYHVLETLVKWDSPDLYGEALKPKRENMSEYCREGAKRRFADLIKDITAKYTVVSYNNTYNSKSGSSQNKITLEEIKDILSEKGKTQVFEKNYRYFNAGNTNFSNHKEYLFVTETAAGKIFRRSPLFYVGDKYKLMDQITDLFPKKTNNFYEPFTGGGSVFLNVKAEKYFLNDIDKNLIDIHRLLLKSAADPNEFFRKIEETIQKYNLSCSFKNDIVPSSLKRAFKKTYYAKFNKKGYEKLRQESNRSKKNDPLILYILLIYGFNRMLRFNGAGKFNLPVGNVDFNRNGANALNDYFSFVKEADIQLSSLDFKKFFENKVWSKDDFIYLDPPYLIAGSEYNKLWNETKESELLSLLTDLNGKRVKFALSNVTEYNDKKNGLLSEWMKTYNVHPIRSNYISCHNNRKKRIKEVLITNY